MIGKLRILWVIGLLLVCFHGMAQNTAADTVVFYASDVLVRNGDYAIDLFAQLPGVEIMEDQITVSGKPVKLVYVNGKLVFGLNPLSALNYLKARQVVTISVLSPGQPNLNINIETRDPVDRVLDVQARAMAGMDELPDETGKRPLRFHTGANMHYFTELQQVWADVVASNLDIHSSQVSLTPAPLTSLGENIDVSVGYNRYWDNPLSGNALQLSYSFGHERDRTRSRLHSELFKTWFLPQMAIDEQDLQISHVRTHDIQSSFAYRRGKHIRATWNQDLRISYDMRDNLTYTELDINYIPKMQRTQELYSQDRSWNLQEAVELGFANAGNRKLPTLNLEMTLGQNRLDAWDLDTLASSFRNRWLTKDGEGLSQQYSARVAQKILDIRNTDLARPQVVRTHSFNADFTISYANQVKEQKAWDHYQQLVPLPNLANTFDFTFTHLLNSLNLAYSHSRSGEKGTFNLRATLATELENVVDKERVPYDHKKNGAYFRLRPGLSMDYRDYSLNFSTTAHTPSVEELRHRIDDTNPLSLIAGNPELKQSIAYSLTLGKRTGSPISKHFLTWNLRAQYEVNSIVQKMTLFQKDTVLVAFDNYPVKAGTLLTEPFNARYSWNSYGDIFLMSQWGGPWGFSTRVGASLQFRDLPHFSGNALVRSSDLTPSLTASTSFFPFTRNVKVGFNSNVTFVRGWNDVHVMDVRSLRSTLGTQVNADVLKRFFIVGEYIWDGYRDLLDKEMSQDIHRLYLSLGVKLLRDRQLKVAITGVDLLESGSLYHEMISASRRTRTWTPVYGRYFLIDITYRFNNSGGKKR